MRSKFFIEGFFMSQVRFCVFFFVFVPCLLFHKNDCNLLYVALLVNDDAAIASSQRLRMESGQSGKCGLFMGEWVAQLQQTQQQRVV